ncbi:MAG TPA: PSD1 and planctomycete cytochrome C domain-containing protein [Pirellulaceae bacterium]|nr:PSD1 and planctomycete cytochrome C domain-containing protein [Pirellulaceae bacterium]
MRSQRLLLGAFCVAVAAVQQHVAAQQAGEQPQFDPAHAAKMQEGLSLFKAQVRPVLIEKCVDCHGGDEVESGFDLATRKGLLRGGAHGPAVVAGKSGDSNVVRFISHKEKPFMPDGGDKLPAEQIAAIAQWIDLGAPYDKPLVANPRDPDAWTNTVVDPRAREFWSLKPLAKPQPPVVKNEAWVRNPIDRFVLAKLEEKGLTPNRPAEARVLIRRAHFDLIGLPVPPSLFPSIAPSGHDGEKERRRDGETEYAALLDQLLDSPHYGERWGRHWLDTARFAESHGFEQDYDRPYAYHFRDFVIEALNRDMPYDQFVRWQLAGDELAPEDPLALKATGFLGAGVFPTQITANEVERTRYDALDDMAATTGSAMLAFSVGCARCHDHKFDPIPQADYYRLLATFTTTVRSNIDVNLDPEPYKRAKAAYDREHQPLVEAVARFEREQLPARLAEWEKSAAAGEVRQPAWIVLDLESAKSFAGATLTKQDDGSLLAGGTNPDQDTFTFSAKTSGRNIRAIRLEALADPSLVKSGPGRAKNGNFALSDFKVRAKTTGAENAASIKLQNPRATFEQKNMPIAAAIDENETSSWAVDPQFGKDHAAVFELAEPLANDAGVTLSFQLDFKNNKQHAIGRVRIAVSADLPAEVVAGGGVPESVALALQTPAEKRIGDQVGKLLAWYRHRDAEWQKLDAIRAEHAKQEPQPKLVKMMVCSEGVTPIRHHTQGADFFTETFFLKRGDCDQKMGQAQQSFLQVLMTAPQREKRWQVAPPEGSKLSYRRTALANWITDTEHGAGHLLARVIVNRLWQHHFGRGIVATPNDFGKQGSPPTHPELLDWLAQELIRGGWRLKPLHKLIMTSATYRQDSGFRVQGSEALPLNPEPRNLNPSAVDPDNALLWRQNLRRLEAEVIRDSMLTVSGTLDRRLFGPGTLDEGHTRRSIYFLVKRSKLVPMMQLFDQPEPLVSVGGRPSTTIAPQALAFLNSPHVRTYAHNFAKQLLPAYEKSPADCVRQGYLTAIGRAPDDEELATTAMFLAAQEKSYAAASKPDARQLALADFCQVLFGLNEFVYVE